MNIRRASDMDCKTILKIVHHTIKSIYPNYYPAEVVDFFLNYHKEENIRNDIEKGNVYLLLEEDKAIATGSIDGRMLGRLYVLPEYQGKGYGLAIMTTLENIIAEEFASSRLEASLPSYSFYQKLGYQPLEYQQYEVENNRMLCYYVMEKVFDTPTLHLGSTYFIVKDMDKSIDFYEKLLNMKVSAQSFNRWAQFNFDGKCIAFYNCEYDRQMLDHNQDLKLHYNNSYINYFNERMIKYGNHVVLNFWVENLNKEYDRVKALNIGTISEIMYVNIKSPYYFFVLKDPDGNTIEITGSYRYPS
jgi:GNAT superfamily N-acetyltransferase